MKKKYFKKYKKHILRDILIHLNLQIKIIGPSTIFCHSKILNKLIESIL
jgi:hypothetical protein